MDQHSTPLPSAPLSPRPLRHLADGVGLRLMSSAGLREHGVSAARTAARCRPSGPWQQILPGVYLLHPGPPTGEERLHAVLLYANRPAHGTRGGTGRGVPPQPHGGRTAAMITGAAALTLHGFATASPLTALETLDVLVPRTRRLRSTGFARIVRASVLPEPETVAGVAVTPVARAVSDAVAQMADAEGARLLLAEAVRAGHCEPAALVRELTQARLLSRPHVVDAVEAMLAEGRSLAEARLYEMVRAHRLPEPLWNVELRLPGGPGLGGVDAYWPDHAVAVELDTRTPRQELDEEWAACARKREHLERLGVTVVQLTPRKLRDSIEQQATVVRTALMAADDREPPAYVEVLPR